ncbi:DUF188 domain-containing protein [Treponema ruminis]|uniref:Uncharacterized protein n=1 Tax=Treponema ruminis TaxID=744515 RepID=A0A7W8LM67_9SPIR|nr:DUF188 domain-containing protein [Treponema ruminis]MBB5226204.1 hypothetical protein [Treponema ruminis]QSI02889.1 DUF188 domain-containing protein [Treponema ruminis]
MLKFSVWVDADSFPAKARDFLVSHALSKEVSVNFVANHEIKSPDPRVKMVICQKEHNAADDYIFENAAENDIIVTRDILFAARLVEKNISVMNDRGVLFSKDNIEDKLREREFSLNMAQIGLGGNKGNYYGDKEFKKFATLFETELQKHIIADIYNVKRR